MMKLGLFGGTFDPVHIGHLIIAEEVRQKLGLERVIFIPAGEPWLKSNREISPAPHRLQMVRRAIAGNPYFEISTLETNREGPSYSVDTVTAMKADFGPETALYFLMGSDALAELPLWKEPQALVHLCQMVSLNRPEGPRPDLASLQEAVPQISSRLIQLDVTQIQISSSEVRRRVKAGLSVRYLVPDAVLGYIDEHKLYL